MDKYYDPRFCGTDHYYKHPLGFMFTDSVLYFCEHQKAFWTLDVIGSYNFTQDFLVLTFDVVNDTATFTAKEDSDRQPVVTQFIPYTDLRLSIQLYWEGGVVLFPSDH